jgi:hypothetical protein
MKIVKKVRENENNNESDYDKSSVSSLEDENSPKR